MNLRKISAFFGVMLSSMSLGSAIAAPVFPKNEPKGFGITFAQVSSAVDQPTNKSVEFESKDGIQGMTATKDKINVLRSGSYLIIAAPQVTTIENNSCVDVWLVVNNKNVPNSGVRQCQSTKGNTDVVVSQSILNLKKGDTVQVRTEGKGIKLDAIQPQKGAAVPSFILTVLGLSTTPN